MGKLTSRKFWIAAYARALRTFLQTVLAIWTGGTLITEVDWKFVGLSAISAAAFSLITSIITGLPEVDEEDLE